MATSSFIKESNFKILKEFFFRNTERVRKLNPCLDAKFNTLNTKIIISEITASHFRYDRRVMLSMKQELQKSSSYG
jgi:hypothetical protein